MCDCQLTVLAAAGDDRRHQEDGGEQGPEPVPEALGPRDDEEVGVGELCNEGSVNERLVRIRGQLLAGHLPDPRRHRRRRDVAPRGQVVVVCNKHES